ncbi:DoxX family protein [Chitinophaga sp. CF418]|uniref:DoxX family protein n=1 Tax=Chitinophaga sp. CF418 TaxID=1855287 RepID=UPI000922C6E7|nr:DoxX family protein [Chitinophaga sp. CF418]SHN35871.1 putative oxidoreductase [Chitinophaga sp. CF418]
MKFATFIGRILFSLIFIVSGLLHFSSATIGYAASRGVPLAQLAVPLSGVMAIIGAASIISGYKARLGALLIIAFLLPVTFAMHPFWTVTDPMMQQVEMFMFLKNMSMLGGALLIAIQGVGSLKPSDTVIGNKVTLAGSPI